MIRPKSPNSFKTCYIAEVKEEHGLPTRRAPNRTGERRKVKTPPEYKKYISLAIAELKKHNKKLTYKEIQKKAFEIYQKEREDTLISKYMHVVKPDKTLTSEEIKEIIADEDMLYED